MVVNGGGLGAGRQRLPVARVVVRPERRRKSGVQIHLVRVHCHVPARALLPAAPFSRHLHPLPRRRGGGSFLFRRHAARPDPSGGPHHTFAEPLWGRIRVRLTCGAFLAGAAAFRARDEGVHGRGRRCGAVVGKPWDELVALGRRETRSLVDDRLERAPRTWLVPWAFAGGGERLHRRPRQPETVHGQLAVLPSQLRHLVVQPATPLFKYISL